MKNQASVQHFSEYKSPSPVVQQYGYSSPIRSPMMGCYPVQQIYCQPPAMVYQQYGGMQNPECQIYGNPNMVQANSVYPQIPYMQNVPQRNNFIDRTIRMPYFDNSMMNVYYNGNITPMGQPETNLQRQNKKWN